MRYAILIAGFLFWGLLAVPAAAQHCSGGHHGNDCRDCDSDHHWYVRSPSARAVTSPGLTSAQVQTIEGTVSEVIYLPGVTSDGGMVEVRVLAAGKSTLARLAPVSLLRQKQLAVREGDSIVVAGYLVNSMEGDLLVATEIRQGDKHVTLRDSRGRLLQ
jgi:hypothetical protein